ncbi:hypothetical protein KKC62_02365 [Patescibacteria group bacterium]|nr:hypothetical protein [Patescibacteria group bacterium]MBU1953024.1 hypothetical protein [Patescibacteria group bacterium]
MILNNYLIGIIEDNAGFFAIPRHISNVLVGCTDYLGYPTGICQNLFANNQPLIFIPVFLLAKLIDPILAYNLIVLGGLALNFFFAFRFFKKIFGRFVAVLLATILLSCPYLAYQSRSHIDLLQFWPVIWFLDTLFFSKSRHKAVFLGLLLTLIIGISNYLGYFTLLFTSIYLVFKFIFSESKINVIKKSWRDIVKTLVVFIFLSATFLAPYVKSNFFAPRARIEENTDSKALNRPFEDFIVFSSRPWYYLLPSVDNPFFGELSKQFLNQLSSGGNYLTQNYFKAEHSASYLGWVNTILALVGIFSLFRSKRDRPINYPALLITTIALILLTMSPVFILKNMTFYSPSYILFEIFPMFRVLVRAGILILFLTLIFTGYGYRALVNLLTSRKINPLVIRSVLVILALFSVSEFFIPLKVTHIGSPPEVYSYVGTTAFSKSPVVIYPYSKTNEAIFWMTAYKQPLINPRFYESKPTGFVSEDFTNLLNTASGLEEAQYMGAKYLVYFYMVDKSESAVFFENSPQLVHIIDFKGEGPSERRIFKFLQVIEAGSVTMNSAILYKFR